MTALEVIAATVVFEIEDMRATVVIVVRQALTRKEIDSLVLRCRGLGNLREDIPSIGRCHWREIGHLRAEWGDRLTEMIPEMGHLVVMVRWHTMMSLRIGGVLAVPVLVHMPVGAAPEGWPRQVGSLGGHRACRTYW